ncbi:2-hydroxy-3-keto-5-methylthiopentenyl-1-phosphat e phosphatase [Chlamydia abortus]|jgi:2-hydroxy-3-keto-5-methylthiopentenyl-1-phosphate phosphatase|uniref:2-hydroxy-3-keto-5-methylthiopentenyl-1-phosphate phosphatase n=1 Tax=Paenibacillus residui TaxID=629724 RepID=A0ABW3D663_9BACL|nr:MULTISPECIES: 2-hydroxy-3-keto-5-methylthiopentenyl-1-phosphate phosphatase [Paenibacillaceae]SHE10981.1 2-hydroxy-3-keto-5-methylthiopentenyl-1-phosphat e phosphatase [Chlamydia abortus]
MKLDANKQNIIFCDFDGTITVTDNIMDIMKHFQPSGWEDILRRIVDKEIPLQEGVGAMFALLPSSRKDEIIQFTRQSIRIREGFPELLEYVRENDFDFLVTSGGIDFFLLPTLAPFELRPEQIYCNGSDFSGEQIRITWPHPCDEQCDKGCGMCKTTIIRSYSPEKYNRILIGDSLSDFEGSKQADFVFARSHLAEECEKLGIAYRKFETFHDVINGLNALREGN